MRQSVAWHPELRFHRLIGGTCCLAILVSSPSGHATAVPLAGSPTSVWIDTDAACGQAETNDVDDCWALLLALSSPELAIRGISTVFGNVDEATAFAVTRKLLNRWAESGGVALPPVHRGAQRAGGDDTRPAIAALAAALEQDMLTILALGPLTNVAALLARYPQLADRIDRIVAVGGTRPSQRRLFPGTSRLLHFHDLNFLEDPAAFEAILNSRVAVSLLPFEAAQKVTVTRSDLEILSSGVEVARWLASSSQDWMGFWQNRLGNEGFHPFDSLAVGFLVDRGDFDCESIPARVQRSRSLFFARDALEVSRDLESSTVVAYCSGVDPAFASKLVARLATLGRSW